MNGLVSGTDTSSNRIDEPMLQLLILTQLEWELDAEIRHQNNSIRVNTVSSAEDLNMLEVKNTATMVRALVDSIKKTTADAHRAFQTEGTYAVENARKLMSAAAELKEVNKVMEEALHESGSNYPFSEPLPDTSHADLNGVTVNKG